ncbi:hypothetical protein SAMN05444411_1443 [Lutibacter oricola]|uniref:Uncharacterized protein n=2 Tax=Lutibacter oricola TaxID=762486 RepID=A0A1H3HLA4_9FLAO|nr:hypothetical protein SAMN05444411_1443 [Lutibacter oricola]
MVINSCQSNLSIDNKSIIDKIDKLNFSETKFEFSIDENDNILDTLSIVKTKLDEKGKVLYKLKRNLFKNGNFTYQTYYRNNEDLLYQKMFGFGELLSIFETYVNNENIIEKAQMINISSKTPNDTIFMDYDYKYDTKGKKETLIITSYIDSLIGMNITKYNKNEKAEYGYIIISNDTVQKRKMIYQKGKLIESINEFKEPFRLKNITYDINENVSSETIFIKENNRLKKVKEFIYEHKEYKNREMIIINDILNDTIIRRKKLTAHNNVQN